MAVVVGVAGALAGAIGLSLLTALLSAVLEPEAFGKGQLVMLFAFTVPVGMILGSATSLIVRHSRRRERTRAGWTAIVGGAATVAFTTAIAWGSANSGDGGWSEFMATMFSAWVGPSWFGGAA